MPDVVSDVRILTSRAVGGARDGLEPRTSPMVTRIHARIELPVGRTVQDGANRAEPPAQATHRFLIANSETP